MNREINQFKHQNTVNNQPPTPLLPQEQTQLTKGVQSFYEFRPLSPINFADSQISLSKISGLSSTKTGIAPSPQLQKLQQVSFQIGKKQTMIRKFTTGSALKVEDSDSEPIDENMIANSDQHLNSMQLLQLQEIRRRRVHKLIKMRLDLELKLDTMKQQLEQQREELPRSQSTVGNKKIDFPSMVQITSSENKSSLNVTQARAQSDFEPMFDFKKTLRAPSTDIDQHTRRIQARETVSRQKTKLQQEAESKRLNILHGKALLLELFTSDLPYLRDNIPGYIFGGENEKSSEPVKSDDANSVGANDPSEGGISKQKKDEGGTEVKKKKKKKKAQVEDIKTLIMPTEEELEEMERQKMFQKRLEMAIDNQYPDPNFKIFQPPIAEKKPKQIKLSGTQQMLVQLVVHTDKVAQRIRYVRDKRIQENKEKAQSKSRVKSQTGPVPSPETKIQRKPTVKKVILNSDLDMNKNSEKVDKLEVADDEDEFDDEKPIVVKPVVIDKSLLQMRNLKKLVKNLRENDSMKRLGLQLIKYRAKSKPKARVDLSQIRIKGADFFTHNTHESKAIAKDKLYLNDKIRLYDIPDIQREIEDLTEDEGEMEGRSLRSKEIWQYKRKIKVAFKRDKTLPKTTIEYYKIGRVLGKGAYGKVNLALHKLTRRLCAVKSISKTFSTKDVSAWLKLQNEVLLFEKLRHPNVLKMYEFMKHEGYNLIFMELCKGGDLLHYVRKRRKLDEHTAKVLFKQIIVGIQYLHQNNIVHRDIKLENILLDNCGKVKICDFGVSKLLQNQDELILECCGTPAYMAPEVIKRSLPERVKGKAQVDKGKGYTVKCDIWSAGVVLYAMLYGQLPFKGINIKEIKELILKGRYFCKKQVSSKARQLIQAMLCIDVEQRITLSDILEHEWLSDCQDNIKIFNDEEEQLMKRELFFYESKKDTDRPEVSLDDDEMFEFFNFSNGNLKSVETTSEKNASTQSQILAPNNSTQSEERDTPNKEQFTPFNPALELKLYKKDEFMFFTYKVKRINILYERHCNQQMDMGIYLKSNEQSIADDQTEKSLNNLQEMMKTRSRVFSGRTQTQYQPPDDNRPAFKLGLLDVIQEQNYEYIEEMTPKNKSRRGVSELEFKIDPNVVMSVVQLGFPKEYVIQALNENLKNYCTTTYYLLAHDIHKYG